MEWLRRIAKQNAEASPLEAAPTILLKQIKTPSFVFLPYKQQDID
jgi:hypothetical protein